MNEKENINGIEFEKQDISIDDIKNIPSHIAFILDGNRRWAKSKGLSINDGHKKGFEKIEELCNFCLKYKVNYLTLYCLSVENLNRGKDELDFLFQYLRDFLQQQSSNQETKDKNIKKFKEKHIKIKVIGNFELLPNDIVQAINEVNSIDYKDMEIQLNLQLCIGYSGRQEIVNATKKIADYVRNNKLKIDDIDEKLFSQNLYCNMPDVDLMIRTGNEKRISNFLLWQLSYAELYFCEKMLPEFEERDFLLALYFFQNRVRRYGR